MKDEMLLNAPVNVNVNDQWLTMGKETSEAIFRVPGKIWTHDLCNARWMLQPLN